MIKVQSISKSYGSITVLADVSFSLERGQKVALVGYNGTGKSTLLRILAGLEESDSGLCEIGKKVRIGYLPQDTSLVGNESIISYLKRISGIDRLEEKLAELSDKLQDSELKNQYQEIQEAYEYLGGYTFSHRLEVMLAGFGLEEIESEYLLSNLSSGQKSKIALIGILLMNADLLLLDEPTNNLDLPALIWLEDFLKSSGATAIVVSHDRRFLDRVVNKIFELDWLHHTLTTTNGNYSDYLKMIAKRRERQKEAYFLQQDEISRLSEQAEELKKRATQGSRWTGSDNDKFLRGFKRDRAAGSARGAKNIEKRIEQMDRVEKPVERQLFEIPLEVKKEHHSLDIQVKDLISGYPGGFTIGPASIDIKFGSRVGILGLNGSGKSTLLKTLSGYLPSIAGEIGIGSGVKIGNMMQEHDLLPRKETLLEYVMNGANVLEQDSYAILGRFGFEGSQMRKEIGTLSPGGRARLILALFSVLSVNVLILDEPTNHLDLEALEALEETLESYEGTIIVTSHDREFLEKIRLDQTLLIKEGYITKVKNFSLYISLAEEQARRLIRRL